MNEDRSSAVSTVVVMGCTLLSRILGFVRTAAIGALFGAGGVADVINLVFNIPNNLRKLLAEGALSTAFIPELSRELSSSAGKSQKLARNILGLQLVIIVPVLLISFGFPRQFLVLFEHFDDPEKSRISVVLFRWMMPYLLLVSVSAVMMAVHNTHGKFFVPAVTPVVFSVCVIASLAAGRGHWSAVGTGVLAGGIAQILIQYPSYRRLGYSLKPRFGFSDPAFRRVMKNWIPILITSSLFALNNQVAMRIASFLPDGSTSALAFAIVFFQLPFGIFSASVTTVLYPRMTRQSAAGDRPGLLASLNFGYRNLWALLLPSALVLIILGVPVVSAAFQRGAFTYSDSVRTAQVLAAYSLGMPFVGFFNLTQRAFYALGDIRRPFYCALVTVVIDIGLSLLLIFVWRRSSVSLALANSAAFLTGTLMQLIILRKHHDFRIGKKTAVTFVKVSGVTALCAPLLLAARRLSGTDGATFRNLAVLFLAALAVSAVIIGLYAVLNVEAVSILLRRNKK